MMDEQTPIDEPANGGHIDTATLELLAAWKTEDATINPEAIRAAEHELSEFKDSMNANRRVVFP
jgi:hypothetical protein